VKTSDLIECAIRMRIPVSQESIEWMLQMHPERTAALLEEFPAAAEGESLSAPLSPRPQSSEDRPSEAVSSPLPR
jgi:hypothetical protein